MTFLEKFERQCDIHSESPSHALEAAGLSRSLYSKWKREPERMPYGDTMKKLADYFGCSLDDLTGEGRAPSKSSDLFAAIVNRVAALDEHDQKHLLLYIRFTYFDGK